MQKPFSAIHTKQLKGSVKEPNIFRNYETEKIICKARKPAIIAGEQPNNTL